MERGVVVGWKSWVAVLVGSLFVLGPGSSAVAAAPTRVGGAESLDGGPLLAGDALAYTQATSRRFSLRVVRRGRRPAVLARGTLDNE